MTTPDHIKRIIERIDPTDREALEQHLKDESNMGQLMCLQKIRQAIGDPHGKLMQDDLVERVRELVAERDALAAHIYHIEAAEELTYPSDDCAHAGDYIKQLRAAILEAPKVCLAGIKAQAIEDAVNKAYACLNMENVRGLCNYAALVRKGEIK